MGVYLYRLCGAAILDRGMYEGIEADGKADWQALATVLLASVAAGVGAGDLFGGRTVTFLAIAIVALMTWLTWTMLILQLGTHILPSSDTRTTFRELLRTTGFAAAPGLLLIFAVVPAARLPMFGLSLGWMFVAMVVGVRHALDYRATSRALAVCFLGAAVTLGVGFGVSYLFTPSVS